MFKNCYSYSTYNYLFNGFLFFFQDGRVLCAIIHRYRPDMIDFENLSPENIEENNQLAFDILEREFGVPPVSIVVLYEFIPFSK